MANEQNNQIVNVDTSSPPPLTLRDWRHRLIIPGVVLFIVSTGFPLIASLSDAESFPTWVGYLDVGIAFVLVIIMILIGTLTGEKIDERNAQISYRIYRKAANLPIILLIAFFIFGDRIKWNVLLPGLAWRIWLLLYILPAGLTAWGNIIIRSQKSKK